LVVASFAFTLDVKAETADPAITMINPFAAGAPTTCWRGCSRNAWRGARSAIRAGKCRRRWRHERRDRVAKAAPDGYTFLSNGRHPGPEPDAVQEACVQFDHRFCSRCADVEAPLVWSRARTCRSGHEGIRRLRQDQQDKMQFASAGTGSAIHLGCALMTW